MLFTRCPDCQTNFRVTADVLRMADGQVRCGNCAAVFNAYEGLRHDTPTQPESVPEKRPEHAPVDSLTETDEFVALEEDELQEAERAYQDSVNAGPEARQDTPQAAPVEARAEEVEAAPVDDSAAEPEPAETMGIDHEETPPEPLHIDSPAEATDRPQSAEASESPSLEFDLPKDEWTSFFEHAKQHPLEEGLPQGGGVIQPPAEVQADDQEEEIVVREVDDDHRALDTPDDRAADEHTDDDVAPLVESPEPAAATSQAVERDALVDEQTETSAIVEEALSADRVGGKLSEDLDPDDAPQTLDRLHGELQRRRPTDPRLWVAGCAALAALLMLQAVHYFRESLAGQPVIGPLVQGAYAVTGAQVSPNWDLSQYEIMDWVATADSSAGDRGSLRITARIHNRGPRDQPYPSLHLALTDRWEATVGSRVFAPSEYLPDDYSREDIMQAGTTIPASLLVVDPGQDAYGFELDICVEPSEGAMRCASDAVFQ